MEDTTLNIKVVCNADLRKFSKLLTGDLDITIHDAVESYRMFEAVKKYGIPKSVYLDKGKAADQGD